MPSIRLVRLLAPAAAWAAAAAAPGPAAHGGDGALIADSVAEFSSVQGSDNWYYGHADEPGGFTELCCWDPAGLYGGWWEHSAAQPPWNLIWAEGQQPGATPTVRRWISEVLGRVRLDITTDHWPGHLEAKTITVLNDGAPVYERVLEQGTGGPLAESVSVIVNRGGLLDIAVTADGDAAAGAAAVAAEIYRLVVFPPTVDDPAVLEVPADPGLCVSTFVPVEPAAQASCQGGTIVITGTRSDGLALDDPYPVGITRIDWVIEELDCPNPALPFAQWILVRADGCPDCDGNGQPDDCAVHNVTQDAWFLTIQGAINAAQPGDEIVAHPGTYQETVDFAGKRLTLRSADGPPATTIDIQGMADSVVRAVSGEGPQTLLDGFTITGSTHGGNGGGMSISHSSPTVSGCTFRANTVGGHGGGIYSADDSHPAVIGCTFTGNTATGHGGGLFSVFSSMSARHCVFSGNTALRGAGAYMEQGLQGLVFDCLFSGNVSPEGAGMWVGVFDPGAVVTVANCSFSGNTGALGSGMYILAPCGPQVTVVNCILWNQVVADPACPEARYYAYNDGVFPAGPGNINADPMFADPDGPDDMPGTGDDDLRLLAGSPCLDAGHNWPIARLTDTDLDGNPRFADDEAVDTGCGTPVVVDMGAYERQGGPFPVAYGDIDGDGAVGVADFLALLAAWGPCAEPCCLADLDLDGTVGVTDFLVLLAHWG